MRYRLTLAVAAALVGGSSIAANAQAPAAQAPVTINTRGGGVAGTAFGGAVGIAPQQIPLLTGKGRFGAGTGGIQLGVGNVTGGINDSPRAGTGGIGDTASFGINTGGITGSGRGLSAGTGGTGDSVNYGRNTGGINGSQIGAGTGGIGDLNSLAAGTGGINEQNAPRFQRVQ
ncbi:MAG: hypothetical protein ACREDT_13720 [Methylocella sp.]